MDPQKYAYPDPGLGTKNVPYPMHCFKLAQNCMNCTIQEVNLPGLYNKKIELNCGQLVTERITRMLHCVQDADASQQTFVFPSPLCRR